MDLIATGHDEIVVREEPLNKTEYVFQVPKMLGILYKKNQYALILS